ncbi:nitroreductase/quinone reductase family protein [Phytoactinopolyspora limicola]|uniref:nitroreductase/quinone reductase family protein n=1 Tax=Phytoactinopolyspora limicola TaxID=2715536 RepID=UPI001A9C2D75|nr:nitroreductase/quinone reductase family protein [Phytoactinopolyspora limicola]
MESATPVFTVDETTRARMDRRLTTESIIWLTTVRRDGQPQSSPVGYLWDGVNILIISKPQDPKVRNVRRNPKVSLHLELDENATEDGGVLSLEGEAVLTEGPLSGSERVTYLDRYSDEISGFGVSPDELLAMYSAVLRVVPTRVRLY